MANANLKAQKVDDADVSFSVHADSWKELKSTIERIEDALEAEFGESDDSGS